MYQLDLRIEKLPKTLNVSLRTHYMQRAKDQREWTMLIGVKCIGKKPPTPLTKASIKVTRHCKRYMDFDGFVGSLKPVIDALVRNQVITDDNWNVVSDWSFNQVLAKKGEFMGIELVVTELP